MHRTISLLAALAAAALPAAAAPPPPAARTSVALDVGTEVEACAGYTESRFALYPFNDSSAPRASWRQRHATRPLVASVRHQTASGLVVGGQAAVIFGRLIEGRAYTTEQVAIPLDDDAYTLFGGSLLVGHRSASVGIEAGLGALAAAGAEVELVQGVRGLLGDLSLADGSPMWWFEASIGTVDTPAEPTNLAAGVGFEVAAFRARLGVASTKLPVLDRRVCGYCGQLAEADAGGWYLDALGHIGPLDVHAKVVLADNPRLTLGVGGTY